jgi:hypothetical protein
MNSTVEKIGKDFDYNWRDLVEEILTLTDKLEEAEKEISNLNRQVDLT